MLKASSSMAATSSASARSRRGPPGCRVPSPIESGESAVPGSRGSASGSKRWPSRALSGRGRSPGPAQPAHPGRAADRRRRGRQRLLADLAERRAERVPACGTRRPISINSTSGEDRNRRTTRSSMSLRRRRAGSGTRVGSSISTRLEKLSCEPSCGVAVRRAGSWRDETAAGRASARSAVVPVFRARLAALCASSMMIRSQYESSIASRIWASLLGCRLKQSSGRTGRRRCNGRDPVAHPSDRGAVEAR